MENVKFAINQLHYPKISFDMNPEVDVFSLPEILEASCGFGFRGNLHLLNDKAIICSLSMHISFKDSKGENEIAKMDIIGSCLYNTESKFPMEFIQRMQANFYAILFPFIRETAYSVSSKSGFNVMIPPVNFIDAINEKKDNFKVTTYDQE